MIIDCPSCRRKFRLPANAIGDEGRDVRCSACKHTWHQYPVAPPPPPPAPKSGTPLWLRWTFYGLFVAGVVTFLLQARVDIIRFWPATVRFYSLIGLPRLPIDLALKRENIEVVMEESQGKLTPFLRGKIVNMTKEPRAIPYIRLTFYNDEKCRTQKCEIKSFAMAVVPDNKKLEVGGKKTYDFNQPLIEPLPNGTQAITAKFDLTSVY